MIELLALSQFVVLKNILIYFLKYQIDDFIILKLDIDL